MSPEIILEKGWNKKMEKCVISKFRYNVVNMLHNGPVYAQRKKRGI